MRRILTIAGVMAFCLAEPLMAQVKSSALPQVDRLPLSRKALLRAGGRMNPIRAMLLKRIDQVSWDEATFEEVLDWLRAQSTEYGKVNVVPKWRALEGESVDKESVVTLEMKDTTVAQVLNEVLDQLSDIDPLTYIGVDNTLKISTKSDFDRHLYTRVYDLQDIFLELKNFDDAPEIDLQRQQQSGGGGGGSGGSGGQARVQSIFGQGGGTGGSSSTDDDDEDDEEREDDLMEKIKAVVAPDSWADNGTGQGTMTIINRQLIVYNTLEVHELLGGPFHHGE